VGIWECPFGKRAPAALTSASSQISSIQALHAKTAGALLGMLLVIFLKSRSGGSKFFFQLLHLSFVRLGRARSVTSISSNVATRVSRWLRFGSTPKIYSPSTKVKTIICSTSLHVRAVT
jgi:hypothetical protein